MIELGIPILVFGIGYFPASAAVPEPGQLVVRATGFAHPNGPAIAKLFRPEDNVLGPGRWQRSAAILDGKAEFRFLGLPKGSYAVVVFHDENDNGEVDHNPLGFPKEPLGFSNGFSLGMFSGKPTFKKLRFEYKGATQYFEVAVR